MVGTHHNFISGIPGQAVDQSLQDQSKEITDYGQDTKADDPAHFFFRMDKKLEITGNSVGTCQEYDFQG
jgi:hypothetical protein